jgi:hypothetical protein
MKVNKLKNLPIVMGCLIMTLWSEIQGAEGLREINDNSVTGFAISKLTELSKKPGMDLIQVNNLLSSQDEQKLYNEIKEWNKGWNPTTLSDMAFEFSNALKNKGSLNTTTMVDYMPLINVILTYIE